jgi:hypothetical protein
MISPNGVTRFDSGMVVHLTLALGGAWARRWPVLRWPEPAISFRKESRHVNVVEVVINGLVVCAVGLLLACKMHRGFDALEARMDRMVDHLDRRIAQIDDRIGTCCK